ncbi:Holliday junction resolvase [Candidatus Woesearchaeota archaeon]|nr:Holliday junction resolvase [Candidatus Woesearchaeota archaeon]
MSKAKGSRTERELISMFYDTGTHIALRAAGSGSTPLPAPDLLVGGKGRVLAIECKAGKDSRYIKKDQIEELTEFSARFGAEPWIGIRFDRSNWQFVKIEHLKISKGGNYFIDKDIAAKNGISFQELTGVYKQEKL